LQIFFFNKQKKNTTTQKEKQINARVEKKGIEKSKKIIYIYIYCRNEKIKKEGKIN
jgi:hypothetical protein